jgi:exocyst complex component 7
MVAQSHREEEAEVEVLNANLTKLKLVTKKIQGSIVRLDTSGQVVRDAIGPIYSNTQQLQITNKNIERVSEAIERLRQPLDAKGREEAVIQAGPGSAGLQQYLGALKRVDNALTDLTSSNLRSNQQAISEFNKVLTSGSSQLQDLLRHTLQEDTRSVEPLHYITKGLEFPTFSDQDVSHARQIAAAITSASAQSSRYGKRQENPAIRVYAEVRGPYLSKSLQNLATASINTSTKRGQDSGIYRQGTSGIGAYAAGLEGMIAAEAENISNIFPGTEAGQTVEVTCQSAMGDFSKTLRELNVFIKQRVLTDCFLAFEIIDLVTPISYRLEPRIGGRLKPQFSDALRPLRETARASLSELLEQTRQKASTVAVLPNDGNTVPVVSETMQRLSVLSVYSQPLKTILSSIGNWRTASATNPNPNPNIETNAPSDSSTVLCNYLFDLIDTLLTSLETRAKSFHRSKSLQGCFLSNTFAVIDRSIRSSPDLSRHFTTSPTHTARLESWRKKASSLYLDAWKDPSSHLLDVQYTSRPSGPSGPNNANRPASGSAVDSAAIVKALPSKDRDKIKEKFKAFNSSFDEMVARHKSLHMEREVRSNLSREVQAMIEPLYARFWDRYHEVDKGKGKNVKYSKADLTAQLVGLA